MADDTNIDEILKSIDALLKEGGPENDSDEVAVDQNSKTRGDIATNDDDASDSEIADAPISIEDEEDQTDSPAVEALDQAPEEHPQAEQADADEQQPEVDAQVEDAQAEDAEAEAVEEFDALSEQPFEQEPEVKRIMLSESMVVEDTPGPSLESADVEAAIEGDQPEHRPSSEVFSDEMNSEHVIADDLSEGQADEFQESEQFSSPEVADGEQTDDPAVDASELDINELVEQITADISARLQQQLPGMVAGLVAEAMQKNLAAQAATNHESTDDTQN